MKIILLQGGNSPEREISLRSAAAIAEAIKKLNHDLHIIDPADFDSMLDLVQELKALKPDLVFIGLHGGSGENGILQAHLQEAGIKFTGSGHKASAICMDKYLSSELVNSIDIIPMLSQSTKTKLPVRLIDDVCIFTPELFTITKKTISTLKSKKLVSLVKRWYSETIDDDEDIVLVVKPNSAGSSVGTHIVRDLNELKEKIEDAAQYDDTVLVQNYIKGRELTVGILDGKALPVVEIVPTQGFYDYQNKYTKGQSEYICPANIKKSDTITLQFFSELIYKSLGCKGYARIDFIFDDYDFYFLEVNTLPGMTELSLLPMAAKAAKIDFVSLIKKIISA